MVVGMAYRLVYRYLTGWAGAYLVKQFVPEKKWAVRAVDEILIDVSAEDLKVLVSLATPVMGDDSLQASLENVTR